MIYAIFILDASGTPIYIWKHEKAPSTLFKGRDEILVGNLISALLSFGQETFAAPQRIDFDGYALTFFSEKIRDRPIWITAVSDSIDHRRATTRVLKSLAKSIRNVLEDISIEEGMVLETESTQQTLNTIIANNLKNHLRALPDIRSSSLKSFLPSLLITIILGYLYYMFFSLREVSSILTLILGSDVLAGGFIIVSCAFLIGIISGYVSSNTLSGFLSGYLANIIASILGVPGIIRGLIFWMMSFPLISGIIGGIVGFYLDTVKLKIMSPHYIREGEEKKIEDITEIPEEIMEDVEII